MLNSLFSPSKDKELEDILDKFDDYISRLEPKSEITSEAINIEELFIRKRKMLDEIVRGQVLFSSFHIDKKGSNLTLTSTWTQNSFTPPHHHPKYYQTIKVVSGKLAIWNEKGSSDIITPDRRIRKCNLPQCKVLEDNYCIPPGVIHRTQTISEKTTFITIFSVNK